MLWNSSHLRRVQRHGCFIRAQKQVRTFRCKFTSVSVCTKTNCRHTTHLCVFLLQLGHLTRWEITHLSTYSIIEEEYSSALQSKSPPLQVPRLCPPTPCVYASWRIFTETGLQRAALPVLIFFLHLFVSSSVGQGNNFPVFMYMWICCTNMHFVHVVTLFVNGLCQLLFQLICL